MVHDNNGAKHVIQCPRLHEVKHQKGTDGTMFNIIVDLERVSAIQVLEFGQKAVLWLQHLSPLAVQTPEEVEAVRRAWDCYRARDFLSIADED